MEEQHHKFMASIHQAVRRLTPNLAKSRSREIQCYNDPFALQFDKHLYSAVVDVPGKFKSDYECINPNLTASTLHEILV